MAGTVTLITWGLSHSAGSQLSKDIPTLANKTVGYLVLTCILIFYIASKSFSFVMQYSQKDVQGFVLLQRLTLPTKGYPV